MKLRTLILVGLAVGVVQTCPSVQAARTMSATGNCSFVGFRPHYHGALREAPALIGGQRLVGGGAQCDATYTAELRLATDLDRLQGSAMSAGRDTESLVVDLETEQGDADAAHRDSMLATFETGGQGVCRGIQATRNDADAVRVDRGVMGGDLATFSADYRAATSTLSEVTVDAGTLRRDIASARYMPPGATSDLAAMPGAIDSARSTLVVAHSFVAGTLRTAAALATKTNGYSATAQDACNQLGP
jgi:hypothetical protein